MMYIEHFVRFTCCRFTSTSQDIMPHKHKRDRAKNDASHYDLRPSKAAQSLPVKNTTLAKNPTKKRKRAQLDDDTPRAFTRLLTGYRPPRSGLDDGVRPSKKSKSSQPTTETKTIAPPSTLPAPTIQPNEPLSSFNARVDAALPFSGLSRKSGGGKEVEKERKTKTERKMQKMQKEWREEEQRRKVKLEERDDEGGVDEGGVDDLLRVSKKVKRKGGKKKRAGNENEAHLDDDEDPWAHIQAKRFEGGDASALKGSKGGLIGLHDVVLAPPKFTKLPRGKENHNIHKGTVGLKRQAELTEARQSIVEGYRQMMRDKRGQTE